MTLRPPFRGLLLLVALLLVWEIIGDPASPYYPPPSAWWDAIRLLNEQGVLLPAFGATVRVMSISFVLVIVIGAIFGAMLGSLPRVERMLAPTIEVCRALPPAVLVPVVVLSLGATQISAVFVTTFTAMWVIVLNTATAVQAIPATRLDAARSLKMSRTSTIIKVLLPSIIPGITLGFRVAAPIILIVVILTEMLTAIPGMGRLLVEAQQNYAVARMFGVLALVGALGYLLNLLVASLQEWFGGAWQNAE